MFLSHPKQNKKNTFKLQNFYPHTYGFNLEIPEGLTIVLGSS